MKDAPKRDKPWGEVWEVALFLLILRQNWPSVSAAAEGPRKTEAVMRMQQEVQIKKGRWTEEIAQRWTQSKGEDRTEK